MKTFDLSLSNAWSLLELAIEFQHSAGERTCWRYCIISLMFRLVPAARSVSSSGDSVISVPEVELISGSDLKYSLKVITFGETKKKKSLSPLLFPERTGPFSGCRAVLTLLRGSTCGKVWEQLEETRCLGKVGLFS